MKIQFLAGIAALVINCQWSSNSNRTNTTHIQGDKIIREEVSGEDFDSTSSKVTANPVWESENKYCGKCWGPSLH